ncbi:MAG: FKBP-type peptidylprolyl isomerase [Acidobacteria bacterium]|nr:FKBP-type peptidylprolyl isomerase [Acidobacteriota bacterium]NIM61629.1 FKBP-type peptidylprolyl isomerase [Acidobacteriota bacterium]NIO58893.1 FKBP-type peptidylprolyl isomerase [Acidobacteriota bacterium]NIQ29944.1 FKBP-type peptidylprolyl isomerase [Acidobacteriota bacterium]NIQ87437.1 FKBP-type peptidylprolyl isomerase [Acidobacteriota bacterium]
MRHARKRLPVVVVAIGLLVPLAGAIAREDTSPPPRSTLPDIPAPPDLTAPPEGAIRTESGLVWRLLGEPAAAAERPGPTDTVDVRYTGWTADGKVFDTTEVGKRSRRFRVGGAIPGFEEGIQLLSVGETGRFWVPERLAYPEGGDRPSGMLVFDVTLVAIQRGPARPPHLETPPEDAVRSESGLAWVVLETGDSAQGSPEGEATVLVEYHGWTTEGELLDSTLHRGQPRAFTLHLVIDGFREAFSTMVPGERRLIWIPEELTKLDGRTTLDQTVVFDMKLLSFMSKPDDRENVMTVPDDAERSESGLAWKVLQPGTGELHAQEGDTVEILYTIWSGDGEVFDSSYAHARPGRFELNETMPAGFNEALFSMVTGEKRLVWIPEALAYGGRKDRPQGMLVFEMQLLSIEPREVDADPGNS